MESIIKDMQNNLEDNLKDIDYKTDILDQELEIELMSLNYLFYILY